MGDCRPGRKRTSPQVSSSLIALFQKPPAPFNCVLLLGDPDDDDRKEDYHLASSWAAAELPTLAKGRFASIHCR